MAEISPDELSRALLGYVEEMHVELARMAAGAGRTELAARIRDVAAEAAAVMLSPPDLQAGDRRDLRG